MDNRVLQKLIPTMTAAVLLALGAVAFGQHPGPQPIDGTPDEPGPDWTLEVINGGTTSIYQSATSVFPDASKPFESSEPTNLLETLYVPMIDSGGDEIPNSLPSTPENPYNLHPDPIVTEIDPRSPDWDLDLIFNQLTAAVDSADRRATNKVFFRNGEGVPADPRRGRIDRTGSDAGSMPRLRNRIDYDQVRFAIDILEGNPINRSYSGLALLNYKGPSQVKSVDPATNIVTVHQSWQNQRILSDAMFIDPTTIPDDEEWTIRYVVDCLFWGEEDFAPMNMFFDDPNDIGGAIRPNFMMDSTFFPMLPGNRYVFDVAMPPHRFWNLNYNWGWRNHPPRIQAIEKANKVVGGQNIVQWERDVFGDDPTASTLAKLQAISMIGDLAPAKRMWLALQAIRFTENHNVPNWIKRLLVREINAAYDDWNQRQRLPRGIQQAEGDFAQTLVYLNNTLYGGMHRVLDKSAQGWPEWETRGEVLKVKLLNGDYFPHFYMNVDFGGRRGWENTFQHSISLGGQGPWFTFGRAHWWPNLISPAQVPAADRFGTRSTSETVTLANLTSEKDLGNRMLDLSEFGLGIEIVPGTSPNPPSTGIKPGTATNSPGAGLTAGQLGSDDATSSIEQRRAEIEGSVPAIAVAQRNSAPVPEGHIVPEWLRLGDTPPAVLRSFGGLGEHNVELELRFDPSQRLRIYQFDPMHHNQAILSIH